MLATASIQCSTDLQRQSLRTDSGKSKAFESILLPVVSLIGFTLCESSTVAV